ncbi:B12 binding domain-containing protein [Desulfatibacillum alkenivorans DSM 16219]|jgi:hypothetical protein|uniref:B12 binding domain-containing protein n=1 Tax=Desulfatibacillum alkenivorans DSM 16219 TaxID=1121393 RepID=A0A1M6BSJ4_9BACT|nr:cobalamin-dependent protein [Desulfatibacillum alkenivorans]SHI51712.1 B12 binding domain-containing protein [Desulfatibacillum alkenivorans DSM 16219]
MILYVHPDSKMMLRCILPMSLPAVINRIDAPVLGRYHDEWTKYEVRRADVIIMDIHWFTAMKSAIELSCRFKKINPEAVIIAGGVSASVFRKQLLRDSKIDYLIRGDGEIPLAEFVRIYQEGGDLSLVPNLACKDWESENQYSLSKEDFDANDYRDISFFPSLKKILLRLHKTCNGKAYPTYPHLMVFRGCPLHCHCCYGTPENQKRVFGRSWVVRSPERIRDDLRAWSRAPSIQYLNIFHEFTGTMPMDYTRTVLSENYNLFIAWDIVVPPSKEALELLTQSFLGGAIQFSLDARHTTSQKLESVELLIDRIRQVQKTKRFMVRLCYAKRFLDASPEYARALQNVHKATNCALCRTDSWWGDDLEPNPNGLCSEMQYQQCLKDTGKYSLWNMMYSTGVATHARLPNFTQKTSEIIYNHLGDSFFLKKLIAGKHPD